MPYHKSYKQAKSPTSICTSAKNECLLRKRQSHTLISQGSEDPASSIYNAYCTALPSSRADPEQLVYPCTHLYIQLLRSLHKFIFHVVTQLATFLRYKFALDFRGQGGCSYSKINLYSMFIMSERIFAALITLCNATDIVLIYYIGL